MPHTTDPLAQSIESLLRTIPERWHDFDHDDLTANEQQALFLLVAAGLVERRFGLRLEMAGRGEVIEAILAATVVGCWQRTMSTMPLLMMMPAKLSRCVRASSARRPADGQMTTEDLVNTHPNTSPAASGRDH